MWILNMMIQSLWTNTCSDKYKTHNYKNNKSDNQIT